MPGTGGSRGRAPVAMTSTVEGNGLAVGEREPLAGAVDGAHLDAAAERDGVLFVEGLRPKRQQVVGGILEEGLGERRALIGHIVLGGDERQPAVVALAAQTGGGLRAAVPAADNDNSILVHARSRKRSWWARQDSNLRPDRYERPALTAELRAPKKRGLGYTGKRPADKCAHAQDDPEGEKTDESPDPRLDRRARRSASGHARPRPAGPGFGQRGSGPPPAPSASGLRDRAAPAVRGGPDVHPGGDGDGHVMVTPDIAIVTIGVVTRGATASAALGDNSQNLNAAIAAIRAAGVADKDIATSGFADEPALPAAPRRRARRRAAAHHRLRGVEHRARHHPRHRHLRRPAGQGDRRPAPTR